MQAIKQSPSDKSADTPPQKATVHAMDSRPPTLRLDLRSRPATLDASNVPLPREILERELDRVQSAVQSSESNFGQQLNWLLLAQALFLNAYLLVLVFGNGPSVPGRRWLLAGLAISAALFAAFTYLALRGSRDALRTLRATRRELESKLALQGRAPVFAHKNAMNARLSSFATGVLPITFIVGWLAISIYALATPNATSTPQSAAPAAPAHSAASNNATPTSNTSRTTARPAAVRNGNGTAPAPAANRTPELTAPPPAETDERPKRTGFKW